MSDKGENSAGKSEIVCNLCGIGHLGYVRVHIINGPARVSGYIMSVLVIMLMIGIGINVVFELSSYIDTIGRKSDRLEKDRKQLTQLQVKMNTLREEFSDAETNMNKASNAYRDLLISDTGTESSFRKKYPNYSEYKQLVTEYELIINDEKYDDDIFEKYKRAQRSLSSLESNYKTNSTELSDKLTRLGNTKAAKKLVKRKQNKVDAEYANKRHELIGKLERHKNEYELYKRGIRKKLKKYQEYLKKAEIDRINVTDELTKEKFRLEKKFLDSKNRYTEIKDKISVNKRDMNILKKEIDSLYDRKNSDFIEKVRILLINAGVFVFLFVINTVGWLLIMKKTVLKCDACSAIFDVDLPSFKSIEKSEKKI